MSLPAITGIDSWNATSAREIDEKDQLIIEGASKPVSVGEFVTSSRFDKYGSSEMREKYLKTRVSWKSLDGNPLKNPLSIASSLDDYRQKILGSPKSCAAAPPKPKEPADWEEALTEADPSGMNFKCLLVPGKQYTSEGLEAMLRENEKRLKAVDGRIEDQRNKGTGKINKSDLAESERLRSQNRALIVLGRCFSHVSKNGTTITLGDVLPAIERTNRYLIATDVPYYRVLENGELVSKKRPTSVH